MRVLVVNVHFAPDSYGGATVVAEGVARALAATGDQVLAVSVAVRADLPPYSTFRADTGRVSHLQVTLPPGLAPSASWWNPRAARAVAQAAQAFGADIAHVHCLQGLGAGVVPALAATGVPVVLSVHDDWWICARQFMARPDGHACPGARPGGPRCQGCGGDRARWLCAAAAAATRVTYPSAHTLAVHKTAGFAPDRGEVWANGVALPGARYWSLRAARRAADARVVFGYVGGPSAIKGWPLLRQALSAVPPDVQGVLVDGSPHGSWWAGTVPSALAGEWRVVPRFDAQGRDAFYAGIDVLLFPSLWHESFGLTIREALARGIRVIQTPIGGTLEPGAASLTRLLPTVPTARHLRAAIAAEIALGQVDAPPVNVRSVDQQAADFRDIATRVLSSQAATRPEPQLAGGA